MLTSFCHLFHDIVGKKTTGSPRKVTFFSRTADSITTTLFHSTPLIRMENKKDPHKKLSLISGELKKNGSEFNEVSVKTPFFLE